MQQSLVNLGRFIFASSIILGWVFGSVIALNSADAQSPRIVSLSHKNWIFGRFGCSLTWVEDASGAFTPSIQPRDNNVDTREGVATLSSADTGELLLYSDGDDAWIADGSSINSEPLGGNPSASQSAMIVPFPASASEYYIFTQSINQGSIRYATFDLSINQQTSATLVLDGTSDSSEVLGVTKHRNGRDYWLIAADQINQSILVFAITPDGISAATVFNQNSPVAFGLGQVVFSSRSNKLVISGHSTNIWDFNPNTGEVSNQQPLVISYKNSLYVNI